MKEYVLSKASNCFIHQQLTTTTTTPHYCSETISQTTRERLLVCGSIHGGRLRGNECASEICAAVGSRTMGSVSSDDGSDQQSDRCGSYSLSADVSESESCSSFSCRRFDAEGASSSMTSSPRPIAGNFCVQPPVMLPVIGGKDVVAWDEKPEKRDADLSGTNLSLFFCGLILFLISVLKGILAQCLTLSGFGVIMFPNLVPRKMSKFSLIISICGDLVLFYLKIFTLFN